MASVDALCWAANDPVRLAHFWAGVLCTDVAENSPGAPELPPSGVGELPIRFAATADRKTSANQMHVDLTSSSFDDQQQTVARALALGAQHIDVGQRPEELHVVLADPEGNEFCVIEPGNAFLAECGFVGALACDGSQQVGYFWSAALDWPLVWDRDEETAIRSPDGGPKITWGGTQASGHTRLHLDLTADGDVQAEVDRLVALGATYLGSTRRRARLTDPDGTGFCVLPAPVRPARTARAG